MLHLLLWSLGQFVKHGLSSNYSARAFLTISGIDDLCGPILQTGAIYALARLRSLNRLPEESNTMLSQLIADGQDASPPILHCS